MEVLGDKIDDELTCFQAVSRGILHLPIPFVRRKEHHRRPTADRIEVTVRRKIDFPCLVDGTDPADRPGDD